MCKFNKCIRGLFGIQLVALVGAIVAIMITQGYRVVTFGPLNIVSIGGFWATCSMYIILVIIGSWAFKHHIFIKYYSIGLLLLILIDAGFLLSWKYMTGTGMFSYKSDNCIAQIWWNNNTNQIDNQQQFFNCCGWSNYTGCSYGNVTCQTILNDKVNFISEIYFPSAIFLWLFSILVWCIINKNMKNSGYLTVPTYSTNSYLIHVYEN
jgi:hypothetical protein